MQTKSTHSSLKCKNKGQGAIEYLLVIGAVIIVVAVVIIALSGTLTEGNKSVDKNEVTTTNNPLKQNLANSMDKYFIPQGTTQYYEYIGTTPTTLQDLGAVSDGLNICLGGNCNDDTQINNGNVITVTSGAGSGTIPKTDLNKQETIAQEICNDTIDNDKDSKKDCLDTDCASEPFCEPGIELTCTDGFDNDGDGQIDCQDNDCKTTCCGNDIVDPYEFCDGTNLALQSCWTQGFVAGGDLSCNTTCDGVNTTSCLNESGDFSCSTDSEDISFVGFETPFCGYFNEGYGYFGWYGKQQGGEDCKTNKILLKNNTSNEINIHLLKCIDIYDNPQYCADGYDGWYAYINSSAYHISDIYVNGNYLEYEGGIELNISPNGNILIDNFVIEDYETNRFPPGGFELTYTINQEEKIANIVCTGHPATE